MNVLLLLLSLVSVTFTIDVKLSLVETVPLRVDVTFTNPDTISTLLLNWGTPLEGIRSDMFDIRDQNGIKVPYIGMLVRRGPFPIEEEYTTLLSGEQINVTVDLWENYDFTDVGKYVITLGLSDGVFNSVSEPLVVYLPSLPVRQVTTRLGGYTNCQSSQITTVQNTLPSARSASVRSYNCLAQGSCYALSTRWFGTYSDSNYNYDLSLFNAVGNRLTNYEFNGYCNPAGCGNNVYGYVYPTDTTYTVYLCNLFWTIPGERVNTIVHEISHFRALGGTNDYAYGVNNCLNLAINNPNQASRNADNVCYFASEA